MVQTFVPSILIVVLAWFSFSMGLDAIPGRVTLHIVTILTIVTMFACTMGDLPVAYVKVPDDLSLFMRVRSP